LGQVSDNAFMRDEKEITSAKRKTHQKKFKFSSMKEAT